MILREIVVSMDNREKRPPVFPKSILWKPFGPGKDAVRVMVKVVPKVLEVADYIVDGWTEPGEETNGCSVFQAGSAGVVERKAAVSEVYANILTTRRRLERFTNVLKTMKSLWAYPLLLLENYESFLIEKPVLKTSVPAPVVLDALWQLCYDVGVPIMFMGAGSSERLRTGEIILRHILNGKPALPSSPRIGYHEVGNTQKDPMYAPTETGRTLQDQSIFCSARSHTDGNCASGG